MIFNTVVGIRSSKGLNGSKMEAIVAKFKLFLEKTLPILASSDAPGKY